MTVSNLGKDMHVRPFSNNPNNTLVSSETQKNTSLFPYDTQTLFANLRMPCGVVTFIVKRLRDHCVPANLIVKPSTLDPPS